MTSVTLEETEKVFDLVALLSPCIAPVYHRNVCVYFSCVFDDSVSENARLSDWVCLGIVYP